MNLLRLFVLSISLLLMVPSTADAVVLRLKKGLNDGESNGDWGDYIRRLHPGDPGKARRINEKDRDFSKAEQVWFVAMKDQLTVFINQLPRYNKLVPDRDPPDDVSIIIGNRGGKLAEFCRIYAICVDVSLWQKQYGAPTPANRKKMLELLGREYLKILRSKDGKPDF